MWFKSDLKSKIGGMTKIVSVCAQAHFISFVLNQWFCELQMKLKPRKEKYLTEVITVRLWIPRLMIFFKPICVVQGEKRRMVNEIE